MLLSSITKSIDVEETRLVVVDTKKHLPVLYMMPNGNSVSPVSPKKLPIFVTSLSHFLCAGVLSNRSS